MIRQIIHIDEEKCNGCGLCAEACHESAIAIIDSKAKLIRDDYCDGMGIAFQTALPEQYLLKPGKLRLMMRPL